MNQATNIIVRTWNNLTLDEAHTLKIKAMMFFPEIFGNNRNKFSRFALWLVTNQSIVCANVRDLFTSGGKDNYEIDNITYDKIPRIFLNLFENYDTLRAFIRQTSATELSQYWKIKTTQNKKMSDWINLVTQYSKQIHDTKHLDIKEILTTIRTNT